MEERKQSKFLCPVCKLLFNKKAREPIFMLCCNKTACKTCVLTKMSNFTAGGTIKDAQEITGNFKCTICECEKYCPPGKKEQFPITVNEFVLEMMEEFEDMIPVTCDKNPNSLVSWYNTKTKKIVSREIYSAYPES